MVALALAAVVARVGAMRSSVVRVAAWVGLAGVVLAAQEGRPVAAVAWAGVWATPALSLAVLLACRTLPPRSSTQGMVVVAGAVAGPRWLTRSRRRWASSPSTRRTSQHSVAAGRVAGGSCHRCLQICRLRLGPRRAGVSARHWVEVPLVQLLGPAPVPVEVGCMA